MLPKKCIPQQQQCSTELTSAEVMVHSAQLYGHSHLELHKSYYFSFPKEQKHYELWSDCATAVTRSHRTSSRVENNYRNNTNALQWNPCQNPLLQWQAWSLYLWCYIIQPSVLHRGWFPLSPYTHRYTQKFWGCKVFVFQQQNLEKACPLLGLLY